MEGFKNTRKGTNIAAQATAISLSMKAIERGFKQVRVTVRGLGPGRMVSMNAKCDNPQFSFVFFWFLVSH
jgi:ribosomal protein S11